MLAATQDYVYLHTLISLNLGVTETLPCEILMGLYIPSTTGDY